MYPAERAFIATKIVYWLILGKTAIKKKMWHHSTFNLSRTITISDFTREQVKSKKITESLPFSIALVCLVIIVITILFTYVVLCLMIQWYIWYTLKIIKWQIEKKWVIRFSSQWVLYEVISCVIWCDCCYNKCVLISWKTPMSSHWLSCTWFELKKVKYHKSHGLCLSSVISKVRKQ